MKNTIFKNDWLEVVNEDGRFLLLFDSGEHVSKLAQLEVSEEDAFLAQKGEQEAYNVIIKYQNRELGLI